MHTGIKGMKKERASGMDYVRVEKVLAAGESGISWTKRLLKTCMRKGKVPEEWRTKDPGKYRGITLLSHLI